MEKVTEELKKKKCRSINGGEKISVFEKLSVINVNDKKIKEQS